ncbi:MAG: tetratricopeptide repeat protein [Rhodospirillaceae bacterium]
MTVSEARAGDLFACALRDHSAGRLHEAYLLCLEIIARAPEHAESHHLLGVISYQLGRNEEAIALILQAILLDCRVPEAHNNLGHVYTVSGRLVEAAAQLGQALALKPDYADAHNNLGNVFKNQGRLDEAAACYERVLTFKPNHVEACSNLGTVLLEQGDLAGAVMRLRQSLAFRPDAAATHAILATALAEQGQLDDALAEFEQALALKPDDAQVRIALGVLLARCGRKDAARRHFRYCLERDAADCHGAGLQLARLGCEPVPARASEAFITRLYASRGTPGGQTYRGAELVARMLAQVLAPSVRSPSERTPSERSPSERPDILDAGCGTGGVGRLIHNLANRLDGVDISPAMLKMAEESGVYANLTHQDMVAYINDRPHSYDVITCAATLIHFGDLEPVFFAVAKSLREGGVFVFTVFPNQDDGNTSNAGGDYRVDSFDGLVPEGCFVHSEPYLLRLVERHGFRVELLLNDMHEYKPGRTRSVLVAALRRL